jgi:hypothetical protein
LRNGVINIDAAMLIDTHAHLDFPEFAEDLDRVLLTAKASRRGTHYYDRHDFAVEPESDPVG